MKPLQKSDIDALRARWWIDPEFREMSARIKDTYFGGENFNSNWLHKNQATWNRRNSVTIYDWLSKTDKSMFADLLPLTSSRFGLQQYFNIEFARNFIDLRGFQTDVQNSELRQAIIEGADLSYSYATCVGGFSDSTLINCIMIKADLRDTSWGLHYKSCTFHGCDFSRSRIDVAYIEDCIFTHCKFASPRCLRAHMENCTFEKCNFRSAYFAYGIYIGCTFKNCSMIKASMDKSRFINCTFADCQWTPEGTRSLLNCDPPILEEIAPDKIPAHLLKS